MVPSEFPFPPENYRNYFFRISGGDFSVKSFRQILSGGKVPVKFFPVEKFPSNSFRWKSSRRKYVFPAKTSLNLYLCGYIVIL